MKKLWIVLLIVLMAAISAACGANNGEDNTANANAEQNESKVAAGEQQKTDQEAAETPKATVYPLTVKDATGKELVFDKAPERIVSTSPSETEILFALGLGDKIVGVSDFDNYPEEAASKPKMGGITKPNEEAIIAANADLVIGGISMPDEVADKFRGLDMKVYKTYPKKVEDVLSVILQIGAMTDTSAKAEELVAAMREDIRKVTEAAATLKADEKKKVYIEFAPGWTVGSGEFMDELITMAGGVNIASELKGWNEINEEKIIQDNPDVILFAADLVDFNTGKPLKDIIKNRSGWDQMKAIKEDRLIGLNEDIMSRTGPRITQALLQVAEGIYPGLVKQ